MLYFVYTYLKLLLFLRQGGVCVSRKVFCLNGFLCSFRLQSKNIRIHTDYTVTQHIHAHATHSLTPLSSLSICSYVNAGVNLSIYFDIDIIFYNTISSTYNFL